MDLKLKNKVVFVSASDAGIGKAIVEDFLSEGSRVIINGRNEKKVISVFNNFKKKYNKNIDYFIGDIIEEKNIKEAKKKILKKWKNIDILIPNLGSGKPESKNQLSAIEWQRFFEINVFSNLKLVNIFLPELKKSNNGSIVFVSSIAGLQKSKAPLGYSASKSAIISLGKNLSSQLSKFGIRVNIVAPGNIKFPLGRWEQIIKENPSVIKTYIKKDVPMQRFGNPEEIAKSVVFLASQVSSFTTGACLVVDGGEINFI